MTVAKELFIVEGESAASTVRQAMHKSTQDVLAVQGKILNTKKASPARVFANQECRKLFQSLACGIGDDCNPDLLPFSRILIMTDPDADGAHARVLLLTLFDRYLRALVEYGLVFMIIPPLFRVSGKLRKQTRYAWSNTELVEISQKIPAFRNSTVTRFKGIAQFTQKECTRLLLNSETRKLLRVGSDSNLTSAEID